MTSNPPRILCVDNDNKDQSISAQAYLEILQIWTRNNDNHHLLFRDVASAGVIIATIFTRTNVSKGAKLLSTHTIPHDNSSLRALKFSLPKSLEGSETDYILARIANRKLQGVSLNHMYWDYIICFRSSVNKELQRLKQILINNAIKKPEPSPSPMAEIVFLPKTYIEGNPSQTAKNMMSSLEAWVHKSIKYKGNKWSAPDKPMRGVWRTKQIIVPKAQYDALLANGNKSKSKWEAIKEEMKCSLNGSPERADGTRLITITGNEKKILEAAEQVAKFWI